MPVKRFSYDGDPTSSSVNQVRFYAGDTDRELAEIDDKEIEAALADQVDERLSAAVLLDALAAKYARKADVSVGDVSKSYGDISDKLAKRAEDLRTRAGTLAATPFFGGLSKSGKSDLNGRSDDVQPRFYRGQFDSPEAQQFDGGSDTDEA